MTEPENYPTLNPNLSALPSLKEGGSGWFHLPNSLVDLHAKELGARGIMLYALLARCHTKWHYPGVLDLMHYLTCGRARVIGLLWKLHDVGLINYSDLEGIIRSDGSDMEDLES